MVGENIIDKPKILKYLFCSLLNGSYCNIGLFSIAITIVGRAITIWEAIKKKSYVSIYKINPKKEAKKLRALTLVSQYWKKLAICILQFENGRNI